MQIQSLIPLRRFFAVIFLAVFLMPAFASAQDFKVGYVDLQRALNTVEEGRQAKSKLKKEFEKKQNQLDAKQEQVRKLKESLENGAMMLTEDAKRAQMQELQKQMMQLQQLYVQLQGDLAKKEAEATKKIFDRMEKIITSIGKDRDYDLILEKTESRVLFARDAMDLTDELIKRYDQK